MRKSRLLNGLIATTLVLAIAQFAPAQVPQGVGEGWLGEFDHASRQLLQLAEATPANKFAWRPAAGVRSIAEVYMHIGIANHFLMSQAGVKPTLDLTTLGKEPEEHHRQGSGDQVPQGIVRRGSVRLSKRGSTEEDAVVQEGCHGGRHLPSHPRPQP
jgi:hypothetical protein